MDGIVQGPCLHSELPFVDTSWSSFEKSEYGASIGDSGEDVDEPLIPFRDAVNRHVYCHVNIRSLVPQIDQLHAILQSCMQQGVIFRLSETWLDGSFGDGELVVTGYDILRKDRNKRGGGVAVYINQSIKYKHREDLECDEVEALWLEVKESQIGRAHV